MHLLISRPRVFASSTVLLALVAGANAQTAAPAASPAADLKKSDDNVVPLSEFTVSEKSNRGYIASETMTGSRVKTKIIDLPYSVVNLTNEFFEDFIFAGLALALGVAQKKEARFFTRRTGP